MQETTPKPPQNKPIASLDNTAPEVSNLVDLTISFDKHLQIKIRNSNQCWLQPYRIFYLVEDLNTEKQESELFGMH